MKLSEILKICSENETADFRYSVVCGSTESQVTGITSDSRKMQDGYAFVCIKGAVSDGHKYIDQIKDKASVIVVITSLVLYFTSSYFEAFVNESATTDTLNVSPLSA